MPRSPLPQSRLKERRASWLQSRHKSALPTAGRSPMGRSLRLITGPPSRSQRGRRRLSCCRPSSSMAPVSGNSGSSVSISWRHCRPTRRSAQTASCPAGLPAVTLPADAYTARLGFWLRVGSEDESGVAHDTLSFQVRDGAGNPLQTMATYSNRDSVVGWRWKTFDLSAYRGRTIQIYFEGTED